MKRFCQYLLFVVLLSSCSPYTLVENKTLNNADFSQYRTFRIAPADGDIPRYLSRTDYQNITNAIRRQMLMRGYKESSASPLEINVSVSVRENIETKDAIPPTAPYFYGPRASYWRSYYSDAKLITDINKEGILMIDMVDLRNDKYLYTAAIGNIVDRADYKIKDIREVEKAVAELFKKFPVRPTVE